MVGIFRQVGRTAWPRDWLKILHSTLDSWGVQAQRTRDSIRTRRFPGVSCQEQEECGCWCLKAGKEAVELLPVTSSGHLTSHHAL